MYLPFDAGNFRNWCYLGFQSTDTFTNSAGDRGSNDGRTIPEDPLNWSVGQSLFPIQPRPDEDQRQVLTSEDVKTRLCAVRSWKEVCPMPRHIPCWHSYPFGTGAIECRNDVRSCVAFQTRVRHPPLR